MAETPWPVELRVKRAEKLLEIRFDTGETFALEAELLRVESPSAEVQGHAPGQKVVLGGKRHVTITDAQAVGNYAVRLIFDDGHDTGLFTWDTLYKLGKNKDAVWEDYLKAVEQRGLSR